SPESAGDPRAHDGRGTKASRHPRWTRWRPSDAGDRRAPHHLAERRDRAFLGRTIHDAVEIAGGRPGTASARRGGARCRVAAPAPGRARRASTDGERQSDLRRRAATARCHLPAERSADARRDRRGGNAGPPSRDGTRRDRPHLERGATLDVSYILDALTKAARQRDQQVPVVQRLLSPRPRPRAPWSDVSGRLLVALGVNAVLLAGGLSWWLRGAPVTVPSEPASAVPESVATPRPASASSRPVVKLEPLPRATTMVEKSIAPTPDGEVTTPAGPNAAPAIAAPTVTPPAAAPPIAV